MNMKTICIAVLVLSAPLISGQQKAALSMNNVEVEAGGDVSFNLKFQPPPNVPVQLQVYVAPQGDEQNKFGTGQGMGAGQSNMNNFSIHMPNDAKPGKWKVVRVSMISGSTEKEIPITGDAPTFIVKPKQVILPSSVAVELTQP